MATITKQPKVQKLVSTLIPISYTLLDTASDTTNIIAKCFWTSQTTAVNTQIGGSYRLAPSLFSGYYNFDASEVFNTLTKTTLGDYPVELGAQSIGITASVRSWEDIGTFLVYVEFYREYLDATTGLIVVDPTPVTSYNIYIHEGSPNKQFLLEAVADNGINDGVFHFYNAGYYGQALYKKWFTNYPIVADGSRRISYVNIHESEQYMLTWQTPPTPYTDSCPYQLNITTYDAAGLLLNTHIFVLSEDRNLQSIWCGFPDIVNGLTANINEGTNFINVAEYRVTLKGNTVHQTPPACEYLDMLTEYRFKVSRKCIANGGYLRFAFKNMLGGFDMVTSNGKFTHKTKNKFEDFEQSLGYYNWAKPMEFGNSNWANQNVERYSVTTELMKKEYAQHFSEMLSSTNVYLRVENTSALKVSDSDLSIDAIEQPYYFYPIVIKGGNTNIDLSQDNQASIKFSFEMAVNQRNPRY